MAGVFDIELHDVETVEVDSEDDVIEIEEVMCKFSHYSTVQILILFLFIVFIRVFHRIRNVINIFNVIPNLMEILSL